MSGLALAETADGVSDAEVTQTICKNVLYKGISTYVVGIYNIILRAPHFTGIFFFGTDTCIMGG